MSRMSVLPMVALIVAACSGTSPTSTPVAQSSPARSPLPTVAATHVAPTVALPTPFTSVLYPYSLTVPAGWAVGPALLRWDGASSPGHDEPIVDKFASGTSVSAFAYAAPVQSDLDTFVKDTIAFNVRDHGDTCVAPAPETTEPIQIGGEPAVLLSWNCGILINLALTVHNGTGFVWVMRNPSINAATDPTDRALFDALLGTVKFAP